MHILYDLSASVNMVLRGRYMPHTFPLRLMIAGLSHAPLCHIINEFHTSLLYFPYYDLWREIYNSHPPFPTFIFCILHVLLPIFIQFVYFFCEPGRRRVSCQDV